VKRLFNRIFGHCCCGHKSVLLLVNFSNNLHFFSEFPKKVTLRLSKNSSASPTMAGNAAYRNPAFVRTDSTPLSNTSAAPSEITLPPRPVVVQPIQLDFCGLTHGEFNSQRGARTCSWTIMTSSIVVFGCCIVLGVNHAPVGWSASIGVMYFIAGILCHLSCWYKLTLCITLATIGVLLSAAVGLVQVVWAVIAIVEYSELNTKLLSKTSKIVLSANILLGLVAIATIASAIIFSVKGCKVLFSHKDKLSHAKYRAAPRYLKRTQDEVFI
jgi:hypothetical protein